MITHLPANFLAPFRAIETIVDRARKAAGAAAVLEIGSGDLAKAYEAAKRAIDEIGFVLAKLIELEVAPTPVSSGEVAAHMEALRRELAEHDAAMDSLAAAKFAPPGPGPSDG